MYLCILQDIPITLSLPKGFQRGWQLEIYGRVKILPHSFYINLQEGSQNWPHPNIPLHLSLRFSKYLWINNILIRLLIFILLRSYNLPSLYNIMYYKVNIIIHTILYPGTGGFYGI